MYMILLSNAPPDAQYDYIYEYHIVCNHGSFLNLAVVVSLLYKSRDLTEVFDNSSGGFLIFAGFGIFLP